MKLGTILGVSFCLNVVLLSLAAGRFFQSSQDRGVPSSDADPGLMTEVAESSRDTPEAMPLLPWQFLQSENLHIFTANLREAGFPEPVLERIIIAEIDRQLEGERRIAPRDTNYWKTGFQRDEAERKAKEERKAAAERRQQRIKEVLGPVLHQATGLFNDQAWMFVYLNGVSDLPTLDRLSAIAPKFEEVQSRDDLALGVRRELYDEAMSEVRAILGPAAFEEFELRLLVVGVTDVWGAEKLFGCMMTGAEFREFLRIKKHTMPELRGLFRFEERSPDPELVRTTDEQIRALLGEERFQGYLRAKDGTFRQIHRMLQSEPTMELSWGVYDIYAELKQAAAEVREQAGLTEAARKSALLELRGQAEHAIETKMGPERFNKYFVKERGNFWWLDELTVKNPAQ